MRSPKCLFLLGLCAGSVAFGTAMGDSYQKVIDDNGPPKSRLGGGAVQILVYSTFSVKLRNGAVISVTVTPAAPSAPTSRPAQGPAGGIQDPDDPKLKDLDPAGQKKALQVILQRTIDRVNAIVNQPVASVPLTPDLRIGIFGPPWFHPGAITPDFAHVDVRKSQETTYAKYEWVTSPVSPGLAFKGSEVEFNAQTKYFYQDRSLPKKLLTESEMLEVNRLYRIIAQCCAVLGPMPPNTQP